MTASEPCVRMIVAFSPTSTLRNVVSGPIVAPLATVVAPSKLGAGQQRDIG
ncbi:hypothetical protein [Aeromicrobium sp. UC242_57]|uniref:hypothetical protein n=1 Tax=Aeromicrobium sp. UC242_57 TaxID=3374624 RepID=UPI0037B96FF6